MVLMSTLERALEIAAAAHAGQQDKAGQPYILHPIRVMLTVKKTSDERIAAVLHDTVEDATITFEDLVDAGFSNDVVDAVQALTKTAGESRMDAAKRAVQNSIARQVKLADVADNMDLNRIPNPTTKDFARLEEYKRVRQLLIDGEHSQ
jgi:GTP diphosphokinase / guanosine-3',5'-bis(diphosphate) 3'-diphosphatase